MVTLIVQKCARTLTSKVLTIFLSGVSSTEDPETMPALFTKQTDFFAYCFSKYAHKPSFWNFKCMSVNWSACLKKNHLSQYTQKLKTKILETLKRKIELEKLKKTNSTKMNISLESPIIYYIFFLPNMNYAKQCFS